MQNRRDFLKQASMLLAGGLVAPQLLSSCAEKKHIGLQLYSLRDLVKDEGIQKVLETASKMGGSYAGIPESRRFEVRTPAAKRPVSVKVDGVETPFSYDAQQLAAVVSLPEAPCTRERVVEIEYPTDYSLANGVLGEMRRFVETFGDLKNQYASLRVDETFGPMSVIYEAIDYAPENSDSLLDTFHKNYQNLQEVVGKQPMSKTARNWFRKQMQLPIPAETDPKKDEKEKKNEPPVA